MIRRSYGVAGLMLLEAQKDLARLRRAFERRSPAPGYYQRGLSLAVQDICDAGAEEDGCVVVDLDTGEILLDMLERLIAERIEALCAARAPGQTDVPPTPIPSFGFARGAVVRQDGGPNMLVVRGLGATTAVVVCEGDAGGTLRLREVPTESLSQLLPPREKAGHS